VGFPNTFIVGAAKAATTSLYHYLSLHPDVFMSPVKEPNFFAGFSTDARYRRTITRITSEEAYAGLFAGAGQQRVIGEASTSYLWDAGSAERIRQRVPDARIIIVLRDPIQRAFSHYLMDVRDGYQEKDFYDAVVEDYRIPGKTWGGSPGHLYVELGLYAAQVERYLKAFGAGGQVHVILFENLRRDFRQVMQDLATFLGIAAEPLLQQDASEARNAYAEPKNAMALGVLRQQWLRRAAQRMVPARLRRAVRDTLLLAEKEKPALDPRAVRFLADIYRPDLARLGEMLQADLGLLSKTMDSLPAPA
jgi:hypothetical protein